LNGRAKHNLFEQINFSALNGCPVDSVKGPAYPFQMQLWPFAAREASYIRCLLPPTRPLNSPRLRISPKLPEPWISHHVIDHSVSDLAWLNCMCCNGVYTLELDPRGCIH
jgi:hypothetical protein